VGGQKSICRAWSDFCPPTTLNWPGPTYPKRFALIMSSNRLAIKPIGKVAAEERNAQRTTKSHNGFS
jgi:hypothetical protein